MIKWPNFQEASQIVSLSVEALQGKGPRRLMRTGPGLRNGERLPRLHLRRNGQTPRASEALRRGNVSLRLKHRLRSAPPHHPHPLVAPPHGERNSRRRRRRPRRRSRYRPSFSQKVIVQGLSRTIESRPRLKRASRSCRTTQPVENADV